MSTATEITDEEIAAASMPSAAELVRRARKRGLIEPVKAYVDYSKRRKQGNEYTPLAV